MARPRRALFPIALILALAGCARVIPPPRQIPPPPPAPAPAPARPSPPSQSPVPPPPPPAPPSAVLAGVTPVSVPLALEPGAAERAYRAFKLSCPSLVARADASGLTRPEDWRPACDLASSDYTAFFRDNFAMVRVGDGAAFATGYYEPEIPGARTRQPGYDVPIYARPRDLLDANPQTHARGKGRVDDNGAYVPYYDRAAIDDGALAGRGLEIAFAADPMDLFFLQIQGSGRLRLPDGAVMRIGFAAQNGRDYVAIGRLLRERGILQPPISMQSIRDWIHANPDAGRALMEENPSYVFFRELTGPGPLGSLGRPVTPAASVAADPHFVPLGAPVLLVDMDNVRANGLWIAQDTGGAIRGANRFDTFWGAGADAAATAGGMQAHGRAYLLLPRAALERLGRLGPPAQR